MCQAFDDVSCQLYTSHVFVVSSVRRVAIADVSLSHPARTIIDTRL